MEQVADTLKEAAALDALLGKQIDTRKFKEKCFSYLLDYLETLPKLDKDGVPFSVSSLKDIAKMHVEILKSQPAVKLTM